MKLISATSSRVAISSTVFEAPFQRARTFTKMLSLSLFAVLYMSTTAFATVDLCAANPDFDKYSAHDLAMNYCPDAFNRLFGEVPDGYIKYSCISAMDSLKRAKTVMCHLQKRMESQNHSPNPAANLRQPDYIYLASLQAAVISDAVMARAAVNYFGLLRIRQSNAENYGLLGKKSSIAKANLYIKSIEKQIETPDGKLQIQQMRRELDVVNKMLVDWEKRLISAKEEYFEQAAFRFKEGLNNKSISQSEITQDTLPAEGSLEGELYSNALSAQMRSRAGSYVDELVISSIEETFGTSLNSLGESSVKASIRLLATGGSLEAIFDGVLPKVFGNVLMAVVMALEPTPLGQTEELREQVGNWLERNAKNPQDISAELALKIVHLHYQNLTDQSFVASQLY